MSNVKLHKKLSLFYHPLFQNTIIEWILSFHIDQNVMDFITFIEINLRIQKIIVPEFDFPNSLSSAITDWVRELETLSPDITKLRASDKLKKQSTPLKQIIEMIEALPFATVVPKEDYILFFKQNISQIPSQYLTDKLSFSGFSKFLFDLSCSWCEYVDVEIINFFLIGVLYQASEFKSANQLVVKPFEDISYFSEAFVSHIKRLKVHYSRYKEYDLASYENWYDWNYLPTRVYELKQKTVDGFRRLFKDQTLIPNHIEELYESSIAQIIKDELDHPTTKHFEDILNGLLDPKTISRQQSLEHKIFGDVRYEKRIQLQTYSKLHKKTIMPIFGKAIVSSQQNDQARIHTILSISAFKEESEGGPTQHTEEGPHSDNLLYPIWEREISEAGSVLSSPATKKNVHGESSLYTRNESKLLEGSIMIDFEHREEPLAGSKSVGVKHRRAVSLKQKLSKITNEFTELEEQGRFRNPFLNGAGSDKSYQGMVQNKVKSRTPSPEEKEESEKHSKIGTMFDLILKDKDKKERRNSRPPSGTYNANSNRRMILANASLFNDTLAEIRNEQIPADTRITKKNNYSSIKSRRSSVKTRSIEGQRRVNKDHQGLRVGKDINFSLIVDSNLSGFSVSNNNSSGRVADRESDKYGRWIRPENSDVLILPSLRSSKGANHDLEKSSMKEWDGSYIDSIVSIVTDNVTGTQQKVGREAKARGGTGGQQGNINGKDKKFMAGDRESYWKRKVEVEQGKVFETMRRKLEENRKKQSLRMKAVRKDSDTQKVNDMVDKQQIIMKKLLKGEGINGIFRENNV